MSMNRATRWALGLAACGALLALAGGAAGYRLALRDANRARAASAPAMVQEAQDPMTAFRTEREQLRAQQKAQLNDIIHDIQSPGDTVRQAQRQLLEIMEAESQESALEGVFNVRGLREALVSVGRGTVNVLVRCEALNRQETAVILDHVLRETGVTSGNVKIIPVN